MVGEALGKDEVPAGRPFVGGAGRVLDRIISRTKDPETEKTLERKQFLISNIVWSRPPADVLTGAPYEAGAIEHCRPFLEGLITSFKPKAIIALGNQPLRWFTSQWGIERLRGYVFTTRWGPVVGTYHPAYIMRGNFHLARVAELDILKALYVARHGVPELRKTYVTQPTPADADVFAARYFAAGCPPLAFDIETPYAKIEKDDDITVEPTIEDDLSYKVILRISFSFEDGVAISMPWQPPFIGVAQRLLASRGDKIVWNRHFDVPRLVANHAPVNGRVYDGMDAFHFLEPSLPMGLKYAATFYCPDMPPWKLMAGSAPEWYNAADSDVARRVLSAVRERLESQGRWSTFERHYVDLGLVLQGISAHGILVDKEARAAEYKKFETRYAAELAALQPLVPMEVKPKKIYKSTEERLRKEGKWQEHMMVKVSQSLTDAELEKWKKAQARQKARAEEARLKAEAKAAKEAQKALKNSSSKSSGRKKKTQNAPSAEPQLK